MSDPTTASHPFGTTAAKHTKRSPEIHSVFLVCRRLWIRGRCLSSDPSDGKARNDHATHIRTADVSAPTLERNATAPNAPSLRSG